MAGAGPHVTAQVAGAIHDHGTVTANNALCGDPALGLIKHLEIKYRLGGQERNKSLRENESWSIGGGASPHRFTLTPGAGTDSIDFTCRFGTNVARATRIGFEDVKTACAKSWPAFWNSGGAIDLSGSSDPRWMELERRIVLSQYELAAQSAGDNPPA